MLSAAFAAVVDAAFVKAEAKSGYAMKIGRARSAFPAFV
jgi:hypothetical protein